MSNKNNKSKNSKKSDKESPEIPIQQIKIDQKPTLVIGEHLASTINYLHREIGKDEWSGILFYDIDGTIRKTSDMILTAKYFMLKDIGSSASTEFEYGPDVFDFFDEVPEAEDLKPGLLHSHHNMSNFFSSTDDEELVTNSLHYNYYLSLIASFNCDYHAKLAIPATVEKSHAIIKDEKGEPVKFEMKEKKIVYIADCKVIVKSDNYTPKKVKELVEEKKRKEKAKKAKKRNQSQWEYPYGQQYDPYGNLDKTNRKKGKKSNVKSITGNKKNPFSDIEIIKQALSRLIMGDTTGETDVNLYLALKRMDEIIVSKQEVYNYINVVEMLLDEVIEFHFGSAYQEDVEEFADNALLILTDEDNTDLPEDSLFLEELIETLRLNSSDFANEMEVV